MRSRVVFQAELCSASISASTTNSITTDESQAEGTSVSTRKVVRRQGFWDNRRRELTEALVHQVCHIRPLHLDEASGAV